MGNQSLLLTLTVDNDVTLTVRGCSTDFITSVRLSICLVNHCAYGEVFHAEGFVWKLLLSK